MNVLIVESAAKGRTLEKYLGKGWRVVATGGHVETLPDDRRAHGKDAKKAYWANRAGELPSPPWVFTDRGEKALQKILEVGGDDPVWYIATDPDREGEFIAWSLQRHLEGTGPIHRVTFQEVTEEAVQRALEHPRRVDHAAVDSALVRKFLDRLVGFRASKMAQRMVQRGASMGRVQTPTLGFVVEKELEREAFVPTPYFEVRVRAEGQEFGVRFHEPGDDRAWRDDKGSTNPARTFDGDLAAAALAALERADAVTLTSITERENRPRQPRPPFTTDQLLQTAGSLLGWSLGKTSALASQLYEAGHITYIRTDSTRLAGSAVAAARRLVTDTWGVDHLGSGVGGGAGAEGGNVQDAHEAIRPTRLEVEEAPVDDDDARRLYRLIRARTLASQMKASRSRNRRVEASCPDLERPLVTSISWRTFEGWEKAMAEFEPARPTAPPKLPFDEGAAWRVDPPATDDANPVLIEDETRPPARYRAHTLVKAMKEADIGRPSTYSRTVEKLVERGYVEVDEGQLVPTEAGRAVWSDVAPLYAQATDEGIDAELFSTEFTAEMEEGLDALARGHASPPERWETWRDQIRDLHQAALDRRNAGGSTPRQHRTLRRLLANAPDAPVDPESIEQLSYREATDLQRTLREAGVQPAPSEKQREYIHSLLDDLALSDEERAEVLPEGDAAAIATSGRASEVIDALRELHDERRPASVRQRRYIDDLVEEAGLAPAEAAALVEVADLDELTGGSEGSASTLIELLKARIEAAKPTADDAGPAREPSKAGAE